MIRKYKGLKSKHHILSVLLIKYQMRYKYYRITLSVYLLWEINRIYFLLTLSTYEKRSNLEPEVIEKIAKALDIPEEAITELGEATSINIFSGTWQDNAYATNYTADYQHFNPLEKVVELYERLLKAEQEKVAMLQEVLKGKK